MKVQLWLRGYLRQYIPHDSRKGHVIQEISEGTTIGDLLERLMIPGWRIAMIYLNGVRVKDNEILKDGDYLRVYPQIFAGG
jgi:sulfur carrier protein ThiS